MVKVAISYVVIGPIRSIGQYYVVVVNVQIFRRISSNTSSAAKLGMHYYPQKCRQVEIGNAATIIGKMDSHASASTLIRGVNCCLVDLLSRWNIESAQGL